MSKCKITGKVLAIQLGRDITEIVLMRGSDVLHCATLATPEGAVEDGMIRNPELVRAMLKHALSVKEFRHTRRAVFTLCTSQVITDTVTVPDLPAAKLEKLIQANADMYFPVDMQDYQLIWKVIGPKVSESGLKELAVQLWAVPVAMVTRYYQVANACGLNVLAIDYCGNSVATAVGASFARPTGKAAKRKLDLNMEISFGKKKETVEPVLTDDGPRYIPHTQLHLTLNRDLLGMTFVQDNQVVLQRFIPCGANPTYQFSEMAMMLEYFRSLDVGRGSTVTGFVSGALAADYESCNLLGEMLGLSLIPFDEVYDLRLVLCVGAAGTTEDFGIPTLNRPSKARRHVANHLWQYTLVLASGAVLVSVVLLTLSSRLVWNTTIKGLESSRLTLTIQASNTAEYTNNYNAYHSLYSNYSADWDTVFSSLRTYNDNLVLALNELGSILPEGSSVSALQISYDGLTVQFACKNKEEAAFLIIALRNLQYGDLAFVSNLSGGGGGPATSYGPKDPDEEAPTEGGPTVTNNSVITSIILEKIDQDAVIQLAVELTPEQRKLLEEVYGTQPEVSCATLEALKIALNNDFEKRAAAVRNMLTTNPFAMNRFAELVEEDLYRSEPLLWLALMDDLFDPANEDLADIFMNGGLSDPVKMKEASGRIVQLLTKDEENLAGTEALLCSDEKMEKWAIYYLEVEAGMQEEKPMPYLNMEKIFEDLLAGGFNTGDEELDAKLDALIPEDVWALINGMGGSGGGGGGNEGNQWEGMIGDLLIKYLNDGTTGNPAIDALIEKYLKEGTTGIPELDQAIEDYINSGELNGILSSMMVQYLLTGSTGNQLLDDLIAKYNKDGTTGIEAFDKLLSKYLNPGGGGGGGNGDGPGGGVDIPVIPPDTRIYFTVRLNYKDALLEAELDRKGLSYDDKIVTKVEVAK